MSRIGKVPVVIPEKVSLSVDGLRVTVEGPKGKLEKTFKGPIELQHEECRLTVIPKGSSRLARSLHGTVRSLIANMVTGVTEGFHKDVEIQGVGFRAAVEGSLLDLSLGYSHPIKYPIPDGIKITVTDNTKVRIEGSDKQLVGAVAADLKHFYKPNPYKAKGVYIVGEYVRRKEGKTVG